MIPCNVSYDCSKKCGSGDVRERYGNELGGSRSLRRF
jgi:hypothetical protein